MSSRLDSVLKKHPEHEPWIRLFASRDPSGNLKYLDWSMKILISEQALAPEIADVVDLFHLYNGRSTGDRREHIHIRSDIHSYLPHQLANLRDDLIKVKRVTDKKRRKRERLYRLDKSTDVDVVYDSTDLIVRHIKNKEASVHHGLNTKWCISMLREGYFEDYETQNATFFFFERKNPLGDEFDKVALTVSRDADGVQSAQGFTALDVSVDMVSLVKVFGKRVFDIFREIYERSEAHPASVMFQLYSGEATQEQLESAFKSITGSPLGPYEVIQIFRAICCNDAAPYSLLKEIETRGSALVLAAWKRANSKKRQRETGYRQHNVGRVRRKIHDLVRDVIAAMSVHPNVPPDAREILVKSLRRRRIRVESVQLMKSHGQIEITYETTDGKPRHQRFRKRRRLEPTARMLVTRAGMYERRAVRMRKKAEKLAIKEEKKKSGRRSAAK